MAVGEVGMQEDGSDDGDVNGGDGGDAPHTVATGGN